MANLIDKLTIAVYDDGSIDCEAENNNLTVEQAAVSLGTAIRAGLIDRDGLNEYFKSTSGPKDNVVRAFCSGMDYECAAVADWFSPNEQPHDSMVVLFGVKAYGEKATCVGQYTKESDSFSMITSNAPVEHAVYKREDILCWMLMPYSINFEKEENKDGEKQNKTH